MRDRALVLEVRGRRATVLLPGGAFKTIKVGASGLAVGQEVWVANPVIRRLWQGGAAVASAVALVLVGLADVLAPAAPIAVAVVSVDINPSINLMVGSHQQVIAAVGLDNAGRHILTQYRPGNLPVGVAVQGITKWAARDGYVNRHNSTLVLGGAFSATVPPWFAQLAHQETTLVRARHWRLEVVGVTTQNSPLVASMKHSPISVGRYLLWQHDRHQGRGWTRALAETVPLAELVSNGPVTPAITPSGHTPRAVSGVTSSPVILPSIPSTNIGISIPIIAPIITTRSKPGPRHSTHKSRHGQGKPTKSTSTSATPSTVPSASASIPPSTAPSLSSGSSGYPRSLESSISHIVSGLPGL